MAESISKMCGRLLIPAKCLHWERKLKFKDRKLQIGKSVFYVMKEDELTRYEREKYLNEVVIDNAI